MTTHRTHALPWTFRQFVADLFPARRPATPSAPILTGREATARHLFGEAVQWSRLDMAEYDTEPCLQEAWLAEADRRIAGGRGVDIPDLLVLRHWGYTPAEWNALPALVQVDKRESFFQARGLGA
jgi:hypothetical protein